MLFHNFYDTMVYNRRKFNGKRLISKTRIDISLIKSGSGCTVALEPMDLGPSFMALFVGIWTGLAENLSELQNSQTVAMEIRKNCLALGKN